MFTWHAHAGAVTALAFGPGGRFLVSAGTDGCVRTWDPLSGAEQACISLRHELADPAERQTSLGRVVVSRDGSWAAVHREHARLDLLDLDGGYRFVGSGAWAELSAPCPGPDGDAVFALVDAGSFGRRLLRYDMLSGTEATLPGLISRAARALAFSPDGTRLAIGRRVWVWPLADPHREFTIHTKQYEPEDLAFAADNRYLFALVGGKVVVYGLPDGLFKTKLKGHCGRITAMALTPDGRKLWTASRDATVRCWDTSELAHDRTYTLQNGGLDCLAVSPDGSIAAAGSAQKGTITLWDLG